MNVEFSIHEMIYILKKLGYEVKEKETDNLPLRTKYFKRNCDFVVIQDGKEVEVGKIFKVELINHIFKF